MRLCPTLSFLARQRVSQRQFPRSSSNSPTPSGSCRVDERKKNLAASLESAMVAPSETVNQEDELSTLPPVVQQEISTLLARLRRGQIRDSAHVARKVLEIMRRVLDHSKIEEVSTLIQQIKRAGRVMVAAQPHELVIGNMVRRVLATVREESTGDPALSKDAGGSGGGDGGGSGPSLRRLLDAPESTDYSRKAVKGLRDSIHQGIQEVIEELQTSSSHIAEQAIQHIHANEVILTHGHDPAVEAFLKSAHKKRTFDVIVRDGRASAVIRWPWRSRKQVSLRL